MRSMVSMSLAGGVLALAAFATPALADTSSREVQSAVDAYLATSKADASLVGGAGQAGYDGGFWIRGGSFLMKINLTLQTRWEGFDWDDSAVEPSPGGDLSGFSLPRATLKFSGDATCDVHYYAELEFGHSGLWVDNRNGIESLTTEFAFAGTGQFTGRLPNGSNSASDYYGTLREGWIEYETSPYAIFRMGLVKTPTTRQLMTPPEMQQFVDISLASAFIGQSMPGYSDRNRDYGFLLHGAFGCDGEWQYMLGVTNGDGPVHRNVLDGTTDDCFAYSARVNWDIKGHLGYEEGALRSHECEWAASLGAWAHYYTDHDFENPFRKFADRLTWGVDAAFAWGGFSFTAAYNAFNWDGPNGEADGMSYLVQAGYLFPGTAWELAARYDHYEVDDANASADEIGVAVNYYIDGHADKVTLDVAFITSDDVNALADTYAGYSPSFDSDAVLIRLQWQLAL
ncbi:MAG: porin [Planctomycetota bacterium]